MKLKNVKPGMYFKFNIPNIDGDYIAMVLDLNYTGPLKPTSIQMAIVSVGDPACRVFEMGEEFEEWRLTGYTRVKRPKFRITNKSAVLGKLRIGDFIYDKPNSDDEDLIGLVVDRGCDFVEILVLDTTNPDYIVGETFSERHLDNFTRVKKPKWKTK